MEEIETQCDSTTLVAEPGASPYGLPPFNELFKEWTIWKGGKQTRAAASNHVFSDYIPPDTTADHSGSTHPTKMELHKTGGELFFYDRKEFQGIVINRINSQSATIWSRIALGHTTPFVDYLVDDVTTNNVEEIPVAPILLRNDGRPRMVVHSSEGVTDVYSRYSVLPLSFLSEKLSEAAQKAEAQGDQVAAAELRRHQSEIEEKSKQIIQKIQRAGFDHGHTASYLGRNYTHDNNFTVEYVKKDYLKEMSEKGYTINTMPYSETSVSYDPSTALSAPHTWETVVRLIDMDQIEPNLHRLPGKDKVKLHINRNKILPKIVTLMSTGSALDKNFAIQAIKLADYDTAEIEEVLIDMINNDDLEVRSAAYQTIGLNKSTPAKVWNAVLDRIEQSSDDDIREESYNGLFILAGMELPEEIWERIAQMSATPGMEKNIVLAYSYRNLIPPDTILKKYPQFDLWKKFKK